MARWACLTLMGLVALSGCAHAGGTPGAQMVHASDALPAPWVGGPSVASHDPPDRRMGRLERPIAARLAERVSREGLTLDYLRCPPWDHEMPSRLSCVGYFDGITARVEVRFRPGEGSSVRFDAWLGRGLVATHDLVARLYAQGYHTVDCGPVPAYPARAGLRIVCRVTRGKAPTYVVATVTGRAGSVVVRPYRSAR